MRISESKVVQLIEDVGLVILDESTGSEILLVPSEVTRLEVAIDVFRPNGGWTRIEDHASFMEDGPKTLVVEYDEETRKAMQAALIDKNIGRH
jgi:hypothetical protein